MKKFLLGLALTLASVSSFAEWLQTQSDENVNVYIDFSSYREDPSSNGILTWTRVELKNPDKFGSQLYDEAIYLENYDCSAKKKKDEDMILKYKGETVAQQSVDENFYMPTWRYVEPNSHDMKILQLHCYTWGRITGLGYSNGAEFEDALNRLENQ